MERGRRASVAAATLVQRGHLPAPQPGAPGPFALSDAERTRQLLTTAGFVEVEVDVEIVDFEFRYVDEDDAWNAIVDLNGPMAVVIDSLPTDERDLTRQAVRDAYAPYRQRDGSYPVPAQAWCVVAR